MMRSLAVLLFPVLLGVVHAGSPAQAAIYVSGQVITNETNAPAVGITLALYPPDDADNPVSVDQTLPNGSFLLKAPAAGSYRLTVQGPAFSRLELPVNVPAAGLSAQMIHVNHLPSLHLQVLGMDGKPITEGPVEFWVSLSREADVPDNPGWPDDRRFRRGPRGMGGGAGMNISQPVEQDGRAEINLPEGVPAQGISGLVVRARRPDLGCGQVQLDHWPTEPLTLRLQPGSSLEGMVLDQVGRPLMGVLATVIPVIGPAQGIGFGGGRGFGGGMGPGRGMGFGRGMGGGRGFLRQGGATAATGQDGRFRMTALLPGDYVIRAQAPDGTAYIQRVQINSPAATVILQPGDYFPGQRNFQADR